MTWSCRCSSTCRAACASRTPTARRASIARRRAADGELAAAICRASAQPELFRVGEGMSDATSGSLAADAAPHRPLRRAGCRARAVSAAAASPASSCSRTGAIPARACRQAAGRRRVRRSSRSASARPKVCRDREVLGIDGRRSAARPGLGRSARVGSEQRLRPRAVRPARACERPPARQRVAVTPAADGSPIDELFTVSPDPLNATVYTAEIAADRSEAVAENNARSVLVSPAGRKRRVLALEGAPGYEHSFLTRALTQRSRPRSRLGRAQGQERAGERHVLRAGRRRPRRALTGGFPVNARGAYSRTTRL